MHALADYDFDLPEQRIALHPVSPRDSSKLLVVRGGAVADASLEDRAFRDLPSLLKPGDLLVFNDTRVIPARLLGQRTRDGEGGVVNAASIEALLLKRLASNAWSAFAKPGKRLKIGDRVTFGDKAAALTGEITAKCDDGIVEIRFDRDGVALDQAIASAGAMPLPPYILEARKRLGDAETAADIADYQTVFAKNEGAVASPTASLHFTPVLIAALEAKGIGHCFTTLHVGAGTFLPVKTDVISDHTMHAEWGEVRPEVAAQIRATRAKGGRIIAVGTTVARLLESAAQVSGEVEAFLGETAIFIRPGFEFRVIDALITNFHLPRSTLLMLVSAFAGFETMRAAYDHAISHNYRFYSYGDSSLLWRGRDAA